MLINMKISNCHFSVVLLICMFSVLTTWDWIGLDQGFIPGEDDYLSEQSLIACSS